MRDLDSIKSPILAGLLAVLWAAPVLAQEYGGGFARFAGRGDDRARYSASAQSGDRGPFLWRQQAEASWVVRRSSASAWVADLRASELELGGRRLVIPDSGVLVPEKLWSLQAGLGYRRELGDRRRWGANVAFGSASDRPFLAWREDQASASAYYQLPSRARNSWYLLLNWSNNRPFANNIPLPGVAYELEDPDDGLLALIGFPFLFARWRPAPRWTVSAGVFGFSAYFAEAGRRLTDRVEAYARFERTPLQWLRSDRAVDRDRLVFDAKQLLAGVRARLGGGFSLDASAGRAFDRRFYEGRDARAGSPSRAALSNAVVAQAALTYSWGR